MGWSSEPTTKKEFSRCLWCKMVVYESTGTDLWAEGAAALGCEGWLIRYCGVGGGKEKKVEKVLSYVKEDSQDLGGLAIVKLRLFFPLARC